MKVGDLVKTHQGNMAFVKEIQNPDEWGPNQSGPEWINIVFVRTGYLRTGYPSEWIVKVNGKLRKYVGKGRYESR